MRLLIGWQRSIGADRLGPRRVRYLQGVADAPEQDGVGASLRRLVAGAASELNGVRLVGEVSSNLRAIRDSVAMMAREVTTMNASVGRIEPEVVGVIARLEAIEQRTVEIERTMATMSGQISSVEASLHPLRRRRSPQERAAAPPD